MIAIIAMVAGLILASAVALTVTPLYTNIYQGQASLAARDVYTIGEYITEGKRHHGTDMSWRYTRDGSMVFTRPSYSYLRFGGVYRNWKDGRNKTEHPYIVRLYPYVDSGGYNIRRNIIAIPRFGGLAMSEAAQFLRSADVNECLTGFENKVQSCLSDEFTWAEVSDRDSMQGYLAGESARLKATISKFYRFYSANSSFTSISPGESRTLAEAVGFTGVALSCSGVFVLDGEIPLACSDLFNRWGGPVVIQVNSPNSIVLINETNIVRNGENVILAEEATLE